MPFKKQNELWKKRSNATGYEQKIINCAICNKELQVIRCLALTKKYCSIQCRNDSQKLRPREMHPSWKGGKPMFYKGYMYITVNGKKRLQHRVIMEEHIGKALTKSEHIHHINGNKIDNRIENLMIVSNKDHGQLHKINRWSRKYDQCVDCGKTSIPHHSNGRCTVCRPIFERTKTPLG